MFYCLQNVPMAKSWPDFVDGIKELEEKKNKLQLKQNSEKWVNEKAIQGHGAHAG